MTHLESGTGLLAPRSCLATLPQSSPPEILDVPSQPSPLTDRKGNWLSQRMKGDSFVFQKQLQVPTSVPSNNVIRHNDDDNSA
jgi:hypothetical protein